MHTTPDAVGIGPFTAELTHAGLGASGFQVQTQTDAVVQSPGDIAEAVVSGFFRSGREDTLLDFSLLGNSNSPTALWFLSTLSRLGAEDCPSPFGFTAFEGLSSGPYFPGCGTSLR